MRGIRVFPALVLVACLLASTLAQAEAAPTIPVRPLYPGAWEPPLGVAWTDSGACSQEERDAMIEALDLALGILSAAASKLAGEYPELGELASLRFVKADSGSAHIVVTDAQLTASGQATVHLINGRIVPPSIIEIDCETASAGVNVLITTILHELGHALGLDHTSFSEYGGIKELMYPKGVLSPGEIIYPSTLDLYAINLLIFEDYSGSAVSLPDWLPYAQVAPSQIILPEEGGEEASIEELEDRVRELESRVSDLYDKYDSLGETVASLADDVQEIWERLGNLEDRVESLENRTDELESELNETRKLVAEYEEKLELLNESLTRLESIEKIKASLDDVSRNLEEVRGSLLSELTALKQKQLSLEDRVKSREKTLDQRLSEISGRMNDLSSDAEQLKLKISELEEMLEERDQIIAKLQRRDLLIFILMVSSLVVAIIALSRSSKAIKVEKSRATPTEEAEGCSNQATY